MRLVTKLSAAVLRSNATARWTKTQASTGGELLDSLWSTTQLRHARFSGSDVISAHHTTQGRGGAIIQVELRDVDGGNKIKERLRTDEPIEKIFVYEKSYSYSYTDDETGNIVLMDESYNQLEVPPHLFGESVVYLQDEMKVTVQLYDERPLSASIPDRVTCTVAEAAEAFKGRGPTPYKKALLDNGLAVKVPVHIAPGEKIIINTKDNTYASRA